MDRLKRIIVALKEVAEELNISPQDVKKSQLLNHDGQHKVTNFDLDNITGGLNAIKRAHFPITSKDFATSESLKNTNSYIKTLENKLATKELNRQELKRILDEKIEPIKLVPYRSKKSNKKQHTKRELVCMLNDLHYGLNVDPDEVGGVNKYGWQEASRRTAFFINEVCNYKLDKRGETDKVHLIINGDCIAGVIHGLTSRDNDLLTHQTNGAIFIFTHAIARLVEAFKEVEVHYSVGNHSDMVHRREGGKRVSSQVYDNYESIIFYALSAAFRNVKSVKFNVSKTIYSSINLPAGRLVFTHGHILFSKELGNPGSSINVKSLSTSVMRFNSSEKEKGLAPAKMILAGHTHSHFHITTPDGVQIYNAPSLSGLDSYALSVGIHHNLVAQLMFESTDQYIFGDSRLVHVQNADKMQELDKIIPIYKKELKWE